MEWKYEHSHDNVDNVSIETSSISCVEYDRSGKLLAFGDQGGHITVLERRLIRENGAKNDTLSFPVLTHFQSHVREYDHLRSVEIDERINKIQWLKQQCSAPMLLTANDKTIKLWKITTKPVVPARQLLRSYSSPSVLLSIPVQRGSHAYPPSSSMASLHVSPPSTPLGKLPSLPSFRPPAMLPAAQSMESSAILRRTFANAHPYHINSLSLSSDSETFLSADDLCVNLWHLEHDSPLNVLDIKPTDMKDLKEVITSAAFHPQQCNEFVFSTSRGMLKVADLRDGAALTGYSRVFGTETEPCYKSFFTDIVNSITDCAYASNGRYLVSRDYLSLKIWDVNMEKQPIKVIELHEKLRSYLCDAYENESIYDRFQCQWSGDNRLVFSGSYKNQVKVCDVSSVTSSSNLPKTFRGGPSVVTFSACKPLASAHGSTQKKAKFGSPLRKPSCAKYKPSTPPDDDVYDTVDFDRKILHLSVHPHDPEVAMAARNQLFIFRATNVSNGGGRSDLFSKKAFNTIWG